MFLHCSGAEAPFQLDLSTFTGAPTPTQRQLAPELFSRPQPYEQRRCAMLPANADTAAWSSQCVLPALGPPSTPAQC